MPDPGQASPYALEASKYENLSNMFSGIAGNKSDRLRNKLTKEQIRNARLLGDKRAIDLEEAQWAWNNVAKTPEDLAKLLEGISGGGPEAEAAFILGTTPEMVQKWKGLQTGLNDIHRRTTIINDENRKADKAYRDGQIDQVQYDKIKAQTETELKRGKERGYAAELKKKQLEQQILGKKAEDRLTGEDVKQREAERNKMMDDYGKSGLPPHAEPDLPPELQGLVRGTPEWEKVFQQWIINAKPNQVQIDAVASGGSIAGSVSKKAQKTTDTSFWGRMKEKGGYTPRDLRKSLADHLKGAVKGLTDIDIDPGEFTDAEQNEVHANIIRLTMQLYKENPNLDPFEIYTNLISDPNNYLNIRNRWDVPLRDDKKDDDVIPISYDELLKKYSTGGKVKSKRDQAQQRYNELEAAGLEPEAIKARLKSEGLL